MNDNNNEEYFRTLITQPPLNHYNEYDDEKCVPVTVLDRVFCDDDEVDCSTESEDSVQVLSISNGQSKKKRTTSKQSSVPVTIQCKKVKIKQEKGKQLICSLSS